MTAGRLPALGAVDAIVEQASDLAVMLDDTGEVQGISVNPDSPSLGCLDHWVGRRFDSFLTPDSAEKFSTRFRAVTADPDVAPRPMELTHKDNATWEFPVRYSMHRVGDGQILMFGRDMQPLAEVQQRLLREQLAREADQQKLRAGQTLFRIVFEEAETPLIVLDPEKARIEEINSAAAALLGSTAETLSGNILPQAFDGRRRGEFMEALRAAATADVDRGVEAVSRRNGRVLNVRPRFFRVAGDLVLLCRLDVVDEGASAGPEFSNLLLALYGATSDAVVLADAKGNIREANDAFLTMADAMQIRDVQDTSLADFLMRGSVDLKLMLESAAQKGRMHHYGAQLKSTLGTRTEVDISVARLRQQGGETGFGLIIRDVSARQVPETDRANVMVSDEAMQNVMDLVGTRSLKELVSATSEVVEKLCIETAVQLTDNNRVAAAEMLGLSRQSLYVKLRKYGLIKPTEDD
ncbi:transcriptional regulator PpsR [Roseovarius sp. SYSU LYC5161]|uniref:transcriptional regulator PpsR n=1 Tax=Roseovarius halophilus (ex Wu et al. 2025) TaxID=3376060 RepID=UPI003999BD3B